MSWMFRYTASAACLPCTWAAAAIAFIAFAPGTLAVPLPAFPVLHPDIVAAHPEWAQQLTTLKAERERIRARHKKFRAACAAGVDPNSQAGHWCAAEETAVDDEVSAHYDACKTLIDSYVEALSIFTIDAQVAYVKAHGWSPDEVKAIKNGFAAWVSFDDADYDAKAIDAIWTKMAARSHDPKLRALAGATKGFSAMGAGTQSHQDCAVYAVANAAGVPYSAAAAIAAKFIGEGKWRPPEERSDPNTTIEKQGLNGGEVLLIAEYYGRSMVLPREKFDWALGQGHPVMINVYPKNSTSLAGHQIVLTKTFKEGGTRWYEAMDSNRSVITKIYIRSDELPTLLKETGISYAPDRGRAVAPAQ